jgi:hypothetical protein
MRQPSCDSLRDCRGSSPRSAFEAAPHVWWDAPDNSCRHGPQSVTAAWHAISEANRSGRTSRDITVLIWKQPGERWNCMVIAVELAYIVLRVPIVRKEFHQFLRFSRIHLGCGRQKDGLVDP